MFKIIGKMVENIKKNSVRDILDKEKETIRKFKAKRSKHKIKPIYRWLSVKNISKLSKGYVVTININGQTIRLRKRKV